MPFNPDTRGVDEPSVRIALRGWLHAPALRHRRRLHESAALWRGRTLIDDDPEGHNGLAGGVSGAGADILVPEPPRHRPIGPQTGGPLATPGPSNNALLLL